MSNVAICVENLGKQYRIGGPQGKYKYKMVRDSLMDVVRAPASWLQRSRQKADDTNTIWALRGISFQVEAGEALGIIGRNGAGKSTLLKVLARITEPTEGYAETSGRVGTLLEVGTGFHPELTGRENVFLNGAILGMQRAEIARKFDEILDFSGVEKFIDTPVKHYSSGMYVRLAFAVAAYLEPDILVVDEVLAVGDAAFQEKCMARMSSVANSGRTVLFVSHNLQAISNLCQRSVYLDAGQVVETGETQSLIERYLQSIRTDKEQSLADRTDRGGNGQLRFTSAGLYDTYGNLASAVQSGQEVHFELAYETKPDLLLDDDVEIRIKIEGAQHERLFYTSSRLAGATWKTLPRSGRVVCTLPELPLAPGLYIYHIVCNRGKELLDDVAYAGTFQVVWGDFFWHRPRGSLQVGPGVDPAQLALGSLNSARQPVNILVTGAGGLIGSEAVRYYGAQGHPVFGVENNMRRFFFGPSGDVSRTITFLKESVPSFRQVELDIRDRAGLAALFEQTRFDLVIHCAAQPSHDKAKEIPLIDFEVNALGTVNLLELTRQHCPEAVFIYMSTNKVYGDAPNELELVELPTRWDYARPENFPGISEVCRIDQTTHSLFGASKTAGDVMAQEYGRYFGMKVGIFRAGCMTGPQHAGVELHGFLSYLIKAAVQSKHYTIFGYKGKQVRDNIHSFDVIRAVDAFAQNPRPGEVYNLGGGRQNSLSIIEAFDAIEQATGMRIAHSYDTRNRVGDHICYISDLTKLRGHFPDWEITIGLGDLIAEMVRAELKRSPGTQRVAIHV